MNWLLVAIGGAGGSLLRYAIGLAGVALLGPSFPWATIAINVVGSAVIGAVAAATLPGGLLPNSPALRALVMVGLCGGFTTFSSFSLQTLDLLREGRTAGALLNVGLSVVLCLAAVACGYYAAGGASAAFGGRRADAAFRPGATVLAVLHRAEDVAPVLDVADRLLGAIGGGRLEAMAPRPGRRGDVAATEEVTAPEEVDDPARDEAIRHARDQWLASRADGDRPASERLLWHGERGDPLALLQLRAGAADLVAHALPPDPHRGDGLLAAILFEARRPLLLLPTEHDAAAAPDLPATSSGFDRIAVLWNGKGPTARAVRTAAPLLASAGRVVLIVPPAIRPRWPAPLDGATADGTGRSVETLVVEPGEAVASVRTASADLVVLGVRRGRLRDGMPHDILERVDRPLLLRH